MKSTLLTAPDFFALEAELLNRIGAAKKADPLTPVLVVAPTNRLLWRIRRALLENGQAFLNLGLLNHRQLAQEILRSAGSAAPGVADEALLGGLLSETLASLPRPGLLVRYARSYPGALASLRDTLTHLREANIDAAAAAPVLKGDELAGIYRAYEKAIGVLETRHNLTDAAGLARRAAEAAPGAPLLAHAAALLHYGAYDLVQVHLDLLAAAGKSAPLTLLIPGVSKGPAARYTEHFLETPLARLAEKETFSCSSDSWLGERFSALYDETAAPQALPERSWPEVATVAGARAEITFAARKCLTLHREGVPLSRIGVIARSLEMYGPLLETVFGAFGVPFHTSWSRPLASAPQTQAFLRLLETLEKDLARTPLFAALAAGARPADLAFPNPLSLSRLDRAACEARISGDLADWTERLPGWTARQEDEHHTSYDLRRDAKILAEIARRLDQERALWQACHTWEAHAAFLEDLSSRWIPDAGAEGPTGTILMKIRSVTALADVAKDKKNRAVSPAEARAHLARALAAAQEPASPLDREGVAVLDVMQARGLLFDRLILLGLSSNQWPRRTHPDPFLSDTLRRRLAETLDVWLPSEEQAREEERLLLALTLSSSKSPPTLVIPRADDAGRARAPATLLREIARVSCGQPESERLLDKALVIPTDPARQAAEAAERPGLTTESEAALIAADAPDAPRRVTALAGRLDLATPLFLRSLSHAEAVGQWSPQDLRYDGETGAPPGPPRALTASRAKELGSCPLKYFFRYVLNLPESAADPDDFLPADEAGTGTHDALAWLYGHLAAQNAFPVRGVADVWRLAARFLPEAFDAHLGKRLSGIAARFPVYWRWYRGTWLAAVGAFVRWDLERLAATHAVPRFEEEELSRETEIPTPSGPQRIALKGKLDRIDEHEDGSLQLFDYKTGRRIQELTKLGDLRKGKEMQLPLYFFLAQAAFPSRRILPPGILGVGPAHPYPNPTEENPRSVAFLDVDPQDEKTLAALGKALSTLDRLAREGTFPMNPDRHCSWCDYEPACRRSHPPSVERVATATGYASYWDLKRPSAKNPALAPRAKK